MLAGDGDTGGMDHVGLDALKPQPARQPEAVATSLEGNCNALDVAPCPDRLLTPAAEQPEQHLLVRLDLLERMAVEPGHKSRHEPARLAHVDDGNDSTVLLKGNAGPAQVFRLHHGALHRLTSAAMVLPKSPPPHSLCANGYESVRFPCLWPCLRVGSEVVARRRMGQEHLRLGKATVVGRALSRPFVASSTWPRSTLTRPRSPRQRRVTRPGLLRPFRPLLKGSSEE